MNNVYVDGTQQVVGSKGEEDKEEGKETTATGKAVPFMLFVRRHSHCRFWVGHPPKGHVQPGVWGMRSVKGAGYNRPTVHPQRVRWHRAASRLLKFSGHGETHGWGAGRGGNWSKLALFPGLDFPS